MVTDGGVLDYLPHLLMAVDPCAAAVATEDSESSGSLAPGDLVPLCLELTWNVLELEMGCASQAPSFNRLGPAQEPSSPGSPIIATSQAGAINDTIRAVAQPQTLVWCLFRSIIV